jgi:hypothetical protein
MLIIISVLTKIGKKRVTCTAPSFNNSLVLSTLCMYCAMCIYVQYLSYRKGALFAYAVKNQPDQENEMEGLETEILGGGGGEIGEGGCEGIFLSLSLT